ncbi:hypothetical protein BJV74DRAFT_794028 [Russula compacta]|nr:hypothetical protein BJV74DRAFT_794028 [Russula compacta]
MNLSHSLFLLLLSLFSIYATPSVAQSSDSSPASSTSSGSDNSSSPAATSSTAPTSFGNLTTTNSQGSTIITSIPITITPNASQTATSSTPYPSLTGYTTCVTNCLTAAVAQVNCTTITAVACYCTNQTFPNALLSCVAANCSGSVSSAETLAKQFCALDNTTLSFSSTAGPSTSLLSSNPTTTTTSPTSTNTKPFNGSNGAPAALWMLDMRGWTGMALAACGAVFGGALL